MQLRKQIIYQIFRMERSSKNKLKREKKAKKRLKKLLRMRIPIMVKRSTLKSSKNWQIKP